MSGLLSGASYNPGAVASASTATLSALQAIDATNLAPAAFAIPASGFVGVRIRCGISITSGTAMPTVLLGVLEGATVICRAAPVGGYFAQAAGFITGNEFYAIVPGLTPGGSHSWVPSYAVQTVIASGAIKYGGTNAGGTNDSYGNVSASFWDPGANLLGAALYDPAIVVTKTLTANLAITAFDTTNLRVTFPAPASGAVFWRGRVVYSGANATFPQPLLGILEGATVVDSQAPCVSRVTANVGDQFTTCDASGVILGVSAGSHSWDLAYGVQAASSAGGAFKYGGPNTNAGANAYGAAFFELWTAQF